MQSFMMRASNHGSADVRVHISAAVPVEFVGALVVEDAHTAIYPHGADVKFRLLGNEPTDWMHTKATRLAFNTAARTFETGV